MVKPKVSIGICTYNRSQSLDRCLQSVVKINYDNLEIIVVDNNSTDNTATVIKKFPNVKYVLEEKQGLGYARNAFLDHCDRNTVYGGMIDDDETVQSDWVDAMLNCFAVDEKIAVVGGPYIPIYEKEPSKWLSHVYRDKSKKQNNVISSHFPGIAGGNALFKMSIVRDNNIRFDARLGRNGKKLLSGEDNVFFQSIAGESYLYGFTHAAKAKHYIPAKRLKFAWICRSRFFDGISGFSHRKNPVKFWWKNLLQLPFRIIRLVLSIITFNQEKIAIRFFKVIHCAGFLYGPLYKE